jgi:L-iditol 2-dehydrogenase
MGADWSGLAETDRGTGVSSVSDCALGDDSADVVFECAGKQETLDQGVRLLGPGGRLVIVGIPSTDRISFDMNLVRRKELNLQNVRRQNRCQQRAIEMIAAGKANLDPLVTHHFALADSQKAYEPVADYRDGVIKAMIEIR